MEGFDIKSELTKLPPLPGVYIMHRSGGEVIYVGKAKKLKNRVRQYFLDSYKKTDKIKQMVENIDYFEYIVVDNELESLILEANLIKEYKPRYNTLLKDDKNYPYIKITNEEYPRVLFSHSKNKDNAKYFGPYKSKNSVNLFLEFIKRNYKLRTCSLDIKDSINEKKYKDCLYHHIDMCLAPCINKNIKNEYFANLSEVEKLLKGKIDDLICELKEKLFKYSDEEKYEECLELRDKIYAIQEISERQKIDDNTDLSKDIIGLYKENDTALIQVFEVREGKIVDRFVNIMFIDKDDEDVDIILSFIKQYYYDTYFLPSEIVLPIDIGKEKDLVEKWLARDNRKKVIVSNGKIGDKKGLVRLANMNAKIQYKERIEKYKKEEKEIDNAKKYLKMITGLDSIDRIESYDISNISGTNNVASMVVYEGYNFKKNDYRKFRMKEVFGQDDYKSMKETIERRIRHGTWRMPDIFLIDGGKGQVNVVLKVLEESGIDIPVIGMEKDDNHKTKSLVYNDEEIELKDYRELFKFITKIQDETHRFAIEYHRTLRSKGQIISILDDIKGIGEKRKIALIEKYKSIDNIKEASIEDIAKTPGFNISSAKALKSYLSGLK